MRPHIFIVLLLSVAVASASWISMDFFGAQCTVSRTGAEMRAVVCRYDDDPQTATDEYYALIVCYSLGYDFPTRVPVVIERGQCETIHVLTYAMSRPESAKCQMSVWMHDGTLQRTQNILCEEVEE